MRGVRWRADLALLRRMIFYGLKFHVSILAGAIIIRADLLVVNHFRGAAEAGVEIASAVDSATGVPIHSLYGQTRVPTPQMLENIDVLLYDIQDVGARVYTYEWSMALAANARSRRAAGPSARSSSAAASTSFAARYGWSPISTESEAG